MEDNKNINQQDKNEINESDILKQKAEELSDSNTKKHKFKFHKSSKQKKLKNTALLKRGGYSLGITAVVLAGLILLNVLLSALSSKVNMDIDVSTSKSNTISADNIKFLKSVDNDVSVIVCAKESDYTGDYMQAYARQYYNVSDSNAASYFKQTVNIINKYNDYNKKISIKYMDTQDSEFTAISSKYSSHKLSYGDIIVSSSPNGTERYKILSFKDIYELADENGYASYGYASYTIGSNNIETAFSGAISYVISSETKKIGIISGHSKEDYTADFITTLKNNNYEVETISDSMITSISSDISAIIIAAPTIDFMGSELDVISEFLENDGNFSKGLIYFADASNPYLQNLSDFLDQWGIEQEEGILFQTDSKYHTDDSPMTMGIYSSKNDDISADMNYCITGYNVPLKVSKSQSEGIKTTEILKTADGVVNAPVGTPNDWKDYGNYEKASYSALIQSQKTDTVDNNTVSSYVMAFGSVEYIMSDWTQYSSLDNINIALAVTERAAGSDGTEMSFISKKITNESFSDSVTAAGTAVIRLIFMIMLPVISIVIGIYIYIKRRNAQ